MERHLRQVGRLVGGALLVLLPATAVTGPATVNLAGRALVGDTGARNAVVWLDVPGAPRTPQTVVLDQRHLAFDPGILVISTGSTVVFPNNDRVLHNVFSFHEGTPFDLGTYPVGRVRRVTFDTPGVNRLFCNIHPSMAAYIIVVDSPYFALAESDGTFVMRAVPQGQFRYHGWRAGSPKISDAITIGPGSRLEVRWPAR